MQERIAFTIVAILCLSLLLTGVAAPARQDRRIRRIVSPIWARRGPGRPARTDRWPGIP